MPDEKMGLVKRVVDGVIWAGAILFALVFAELAVAFWNTDRWISVGDVVLVIALIAFAEWWTGKKARP